MAISTKEDDLVGIRSYLTNQYGLDNSKIGWKDAGANGGKVTYNGYDLADVAENNLKDGSSYMSGSELSSAIDKYKTTYGANSISSQNNADATTRNYQSGYKDTIDSLLKEIMTPKEFAYDPTTDPSYQAYQKQYTKLGQNAMEDSMATAASLSGGRQNSWSETVGNSAYNSYMEDLSNVIPTLEQQAYSKYQNDISNKYNQLSAVSGLDTNEYNQFANERDFDLSNQSNALQGQVDTIGQYYQDYQAEIDKRKATADTSDDNLIPYLTAARQQKIAGQSSAEAESQSAAKELYMKLFEQTGYATPEIAAALGIQEGTTSLDYANTAYDINKPYYSPNTGSSGGSSTAAGTNTATLKQAQGYLDEIFVSYNSKTGKKTMNTAAAETYIDGLVSGGYISADEGKYLKAANNITSSTQTDDASTNTTTSDTAESGGMSMSDELNRLSESFSSSDEAVSFLEENRNDYVSTFGADGYRTLLSKAKTTIYK